MKTIRIIYWASTGIIAAMMLFSGISYLTNEELKAAISGLGFPDFFRVELAIAKIIGAIVLVIPTLPLVVRQFAYFGFALTFLSAFLAHVSVNDPVSATVAPIVFLGILAVSYVYSIRVGYELAK